MVLAATQLAQMVRNGTHMDWDDGASWGMAIVMIVLTVLVVGAIVWAIVYSTRRSGGAGGTPGVPPAGAPRSARDLLDERYARGEIDTADYEERRARLG